MKDSFGEVVVVCNLPKHVVFHLLTVARRGSCGPTQEVDLAPHLVIGLALQVEDVEKFLQTFVGRVQFGHTPMVMECQIRQRKGTVSNLFNSGQEGGSSFDSFEWTDLCKVQDVLDRGTTRVVANIHRNSSLQHRNKQQYFWL